VFAQFIGRPAQIASGATWTWELLPEKDQASTDACVYDAAGAIVRFSGFECGIPAKKDAWISKAFDPSAALPAPDRGLCCGIGNLLDQISCASSLSNFFRG
jgi:hypothetical protein